MIHIWTGLPGSGKTTRLASLSLYLLKRNSKYYKKCCKEFEKEVKVWKNLIKKGLPVESLVQPKEPKKRKVYSNIKYNKQIEEKYADYIYYFTTIEELVKVRDVDIIWQEMSIYCDSQEWEKATTDFKWWLRKHRHYGIDIYGDTQDFSTIDISVRRITNHVYRIFKLIGSRDKSATRPEVKYIWGLSLILNVDPTSFDKEKEEYKYSGGFSFMFFNPFLCNVFNSYEDLDHNKYPPLKHIVRYCTDPDCSYSKGGNKLHIVHK